MIARFMADSSNSTVPYISFASSSERFEVVHRAASGVSIHDRRRSARESGEITNLVRSAEYDSSWRTARRTDRVADTSTEPDLPKRIAEQRTTLQERDVQRDYTG